MEISTPRQLLRSLGPLLRKLPPEPPPELPRSPSIQKLFQPRGWLENSLNQGEETAHHYEARNDYTNAICLRNNCPLIPQTFFCCNYPVKNCRINSRTNFCCTFYLVSSRTDHWTKKTPQSQNYRIYPGQNCLL